MNNEQDSGSQPTARITRLPVAAGQAVSWRTCKMSLIFTGTNKVNEPNQYWHRSGPKKGWEPPGLHKTARVLLTSGQRVGVDGLGEVPERRPHGEPGPVDGHGFVRAGQPRRRRTRRRQQQQQQQGQGQGQGTPQARDCTHSHFEYLKPFSLFFLSLKFYCCRPRGHRRHLHRNSLSLSLSLSFSLSLSPSLSLSSSSSDSSRGLKRI